MIITISGQPGAGSTTVSELLSKKTNYKLLTVGEIYKQIAKEKGMTAEEFWEYQEKNPEKQEEFHKELDARQKLLAETETNIIFNGKLSAFQIPRAKIKVLLTADLKTRAERTVKRDNGTIEEQKQSIKEREEMERKDWKKIYGFDYVADREYYNMIIDTTNLTPEQIVNAVIQQMKTMEE